MVHRIASRGTVKVDTGSDIGIRVNYVKLMTYLRVERWQRGQRENRKTEIRNHRRRIMARHSRRISVHSWSPPQSSKPGDESEKTTLAGVKSSKQRLKVTRARFGEKKRQSWKKKSKRLESSPVLCSPSIVYQGQCMSRSKWVNTVSRFLSYP